MWRIKFPSFESVIHIAIAEVIVNAIWYGITKLVTIQSMARDWGFVILSVVVIVVVGWYLGRRMQTRSQLIKENKVTGIESYPNRKALGAGIDVELENTDRAYVLWYTGYGARGHNIHRKGIIEKMILIDPRCCFEEPFSSHIRNISKRTPEEVAQNIKVLTKESHEAEIEVRWLMSKPQDLIVISNPKTVNAWIRVEPFDLAKNAKDWRSYRVYKDKLPDLFNTLSDKYMLLWLESKEPDWDEI